jgi:copper transport protein
MSALRRALGPLLVLVGAALLLPGLARAHAVLVGSDPADGARLGSSPQLIRLWFNEDVSRRLSDVELTGARTGRVAGLEPRLGSGRSLEVSVPKLRRDAYILRWRTVSEDDLHTTSGSLVFGVEVNVGQKSRSAGASASPATPGPEKAEVVLRWFDFAALAGVIGALALVAICIPRAARRGARGLEDARRRLAKVAAAAAVTALCTGLALLLAQAHNLLSESLVSALGTVLTQTSYGPSWIARELLICALCVLAVVVARRRPGPMLVAVIALCTLALCASLAFNSHAAAARGQLSIATAALALHLLSAALWAGGVCALAVVLIGSWRRSRADESTRLLVRSFGGVAAASVAVLALTGLYSAGVGVASPEALVTTLYGRTLLAKTALFAAIGLLGLSNSLLVRSGRIGSRWFSRGLRLEAVLAAGVILPAALLTATAPAQRLRVLASSARSAAPDAIKSTSAGDLLVSLSVKPNEPGVNFVTVGVFDTRRPPPAPIRQVQLSIPTGVQSRVGWSRATRVGDHYWQLAGTQLDRSREWPLAVRITRSGLPEQVARVSWTVQRPEPRAAPAWVVQPGPSLARFVSPASAGGAAVLAAALLAWLLLRRQDRIGVKNRSRSRLTARTRNGRLST